MCVGIAYVQPSQSERHENENVIYSHQYEAQTYELKTAKICLACITSCFFVGPADCHTETTKTKIHQRPVPDNASIEVKKIAYLSIHCIRYIFPVFMKLEMKIWVKVMVLGISEPKTPTHSEKRINSRLDSIRTIWAKEL